MDLWVSRNWKLSYDEGGVLASKGRVIDSLLDRMLDHEYFSRPAPKSTGRDLFNEAWLNSQLESLEYDDLESSRHSRNDDPQHNLDILATLLSLTARSIVLHLAHAKFPVSQV